MMRFFVWFVLVLSCLGLAPVEAQRGRDRVSRVLSGRSPAFYDPRNLAREPVLSASSALLMDDATGEVLWSRNPDTKRYPASTTKILTALLLAELVPADATVVCNDPNIGNVGESSLNIKHGESFPADDLLRGFLLRSANDAGVVIAQHVDGSVAAFAKRMNDRARDLGASRSHFVNPHGLHDPQHYSTARDLAILARAALRNPRFADAVKDPAVTIRRSISDDRRVVAKSKRLFYDKVPGADGVKTGYTRPAGHCFVGSATRGGRRLIAVILGAKASACQETIPLIEWGFRRFPSRKLLSEGESVGTIAVARGKSPQVEVQTMQNLRLPYDALAAFPSVRTKIVSKPVQAPLRKGDVVAELVVTSGARERLRIPLCASRDIPASPVANASANGAWMGIFGGICAGLLIRWRHGRRQRRRAFAKGSRHRWSGVSSERRGNDRRGPGGR
jgi:D-alanyl-D-alanine carboxypeptidase (penicillin-binding protein 5/6)